MVKLANVGVLEKTEF